MFALRKFWKDFFIWKNLLFILIGFLITYFLVNFDLDWKYFVFMNSLNLRSYFFPGIILGSFLPILFPIIFLVLYKVKKDYQLYLWTFALGESAFLGWFTSSFLKFFTGRVQPNMHDLTNNISHGFNFGLFKHGIFWGWPSSHTTVSFSIATTIFFIFLNRNNKKTSEKLFMIAAVLVALYIGIGVSFTIHWLSDFVMGAILGILVGKTCANIFISKKINSIVKTNIQNPSFKNIQSGKKVYEVRLAKGKWNSVGVGDVFEIDNIPESGEKVLVEVESVERYLSFMDLLNTVDFKKVIPDANTKEEAILEYRRFYSEEDEKKHGIIAFKVKTFVKKI